MAEWPISTMISGVAYSARSRASEVSFDSDGPATPAKPSTAHLLRPVPLAGETHHRVIQVAGDTFVV